MVMPGRRVYSRVRDTNITDTYIQIAITYYQLGSHQAEELFFLSDGGAYRRYRSIFELSKRTIHTAYKLATYSDEDLINHFRERVEGRKLSGTILVMDPVYRLLKRLEGEHTEADRQLAIQWAVDHILGCGRIGAIDDITKKYAVWVNSLPADITRQELFKSYKDTFGIDFEQGKIFSNLYSSADEAYESIQFMEAS